MSEGLTWLRPDIHHTGRCQGDAPTLTVSDLMDWDIEEGIINRAFVPEVLMMEEIDLNNRRELSARVQELFDHLR